MPCHALPSSSFLHYIEHSAPPMVRDQAPFGSGTRKAWCAGSRLVSLSSPSYEHKHKFQGSSRGCKLFIAEGISMHHRIFHKPASSEPMAIMYVDVLSMYPASCIIVSVSPTCLLWSSVLPARPGTQLLQATDYMFWQELFSFSFFGSTTMTALLGHFPRLVMASFLPSFLARMGSLDELYALLP